jgi:fumarate reductase flavoprotein subunit
MANVAIEDHSRTFNTERVSALELACMLDIAEAIVQSALRREESRGAHQRTDFPARDDRRFLAHSVISRTSDRSVHVEYLPVCITRWPPAERVYGEASPHDKADHAAGRTVSAGAGV